MSDLSKAQSTALFQLFEAGTPLTIGKKTATALVTAGLAQIARVSPTPEPKQGLAVSITTKGRSLCQKRTERKYVSPDEAFKDEPPVTDTNDDESE